MSCSRSATPAIDYFSVVFWRHQAQLGGQTRTIVLRQVHMHTCYLASGHGCMSPESSQPVVPGPGFSTPINQP